MSEGKGKLRVRREDRERLKRLSETERFQEIIGIEDPTYEDVLDEIMPDPADETILRRPEEDMVWIGSLQEEKKDRVLELAGENVSAHHVVHEYLREFVEAHNFDLEGDDE